MTSGPPVTGHGDEADDETVISSRSASEVEEPEDKTVVSARVRDEAGDPDDSTVVSARVREAADDDTTVSARSRARAETDRPKATSASELPPDADATSVRDQPHPTHDTAGSRPARPATQSGGGTERSSTDDIRARIPVDPSSPLAVERYDVRAGDEPVRQRREYSRPATRQRTSVPEAAAPTPDPAPRPRVRLRIVLPIAIVAAAIGGLAIYWWA